MSESGDIIKDSYRSIASRSEGLFKDNGSRFIALAYPVETEAGIKEIITSIKKEYMTPGIIAMPTGLVTREI